MRLPRAVRSALHVDEVEPEELHEELMKYFGSDTSSDPTRTNYPADDPLALTIVYDKTLSTITDVHVGSGLKMKDVAELEERVRSHLLDSIGKRVSSIHLFSRIPMHGYWRLEDQL